MSKQNDIKEKIYTAVDCMDNKSAKKLWDIIARDFNEFSKWALIPEEEPDEIDLYMLNQIENDPDCHEFVSSEEIEKLLLYPEQKNKIA